MVGHDFFKPFAVTFDFETMRIFLTNQPTSPWRASTRWWSAFREGRQARQADSSFRRKRIHRAKRKWQDWIPAFAGM